MLISIFRFEGQEHMRHQDPIEKDLENFSNSTLVPAGPKLVDAAELLNIKRKQNIWNSVKEKLPTKPGDYLVLLRGERYRVMSFNPVGNAFLPSNMNQAVTHWTRLPPLPVRTY